jgi:hypothetical protein
VPLAIAERGTVRNADSPCCAPWARRGERWREVDAYGQVVGTGEVTGGEGYDVTACYELCLAPTSGARGVGLFASSEGEWRPSPSLQWTPTGVDRASLTAFVGGIEQLLGFPAADGASRSRPTPAPDARALYFQLRLTSSGEPEVRSFAVVGGPRAIVLAQRLPNGRWTAVYADHAPRYVFGEAFHPLAVFDMDGDGTPEVIYHFAFGDSYGDAVLHSVSGGDDWERVAIGVGGSTT